MKKFTFGTPESLVPSAFCDTFHYTETEIAYPASAFTFRETAGGCILEFPIEDDCRIFGFGLQLKQFEHRGHKLRMDVNADPVTANGESHAPVPFFVTNKGYGMYFDTARYAQFYCGKQKNNANVTVAKGQAESSTDALYAVRNDTNATMTVCIPVAKGIDVYVIEGETITDITAQYNLLAGGGPVVPEWGLGLLYRGNGKWGADKMIETVDRIQNSGINLSILGLEPGWQTHAYSCTYVWSDLFPDPAHFVEEMKKRGVHVNLWEHAFTHTDSPIHDALAPHSGDYLVWGGVVPDFATTEARRIFADYHKKVLTGIGIDGFKLDECDSSDNTGGWSFPLCAAFPSGLDGEQYHSLFGTLYAKTVLDALDHKPTLSEIRQMGALAAPYPFVLYSDLYDHRDFIRGVATSGFSGVLWTPEVRDAHSKKECIRRLQAVVFSAQCLVNAWYCDDIPWVVNDCEEEAKELFSIRESLIPMLKAAFDKYHETGIPPIRALVSDFTDDTETYAIDNAWLFCDDLLVAPITEHDHDERDVYLPVGAAWVDYFTGEPVSSGWHHVKTEGIPVYRRIR